MKGRGAIRRDVCPAGRRGQEAAVQARQLHLRSLPVLLNVMSIQGSRSGGGSRVAPANELTTSSAGFGDPSARHRPKERSWTASSSGGAGRSPDGSPSSTRASRRSQPPRADRGGRVGRTPQPRLPRSMAKGCVLSSPSGSPSRNVGSPNSEKSTSAPPPSHQVARHGREFLVLFENQVERYDREEYE